MIFAFVAVLHTRSKLLNQRRAVVPAGPALGARRAALEANSGRVRPAGAVPAPDRKARAVFESPAGSSKKGPAAQAASAALAEEAAAKARAGATLHLDEKGLRRPEAAVPDPAGSAVPLELPSAASAEESASPAEKAGKSAPEGKALLFFFGAF